MEFEKKEVGHCVQYWEYEKGFGRRNMGKQYFATEELAKAFVTSYAGGSYECYFRAEYKGEQIVDKV